MKRMLVTFIACCIGMLVYTQGNAQAEKKATPKDHIMMKDGKLFQTKDGKTAELTEDVTLPNGTVVSKDGNVKMKDGTTKMLKEGDQIWMDGKMTHMAMKKHAKSSGG